MSCVASFVTCVNRPSVGRNVTSDAGVDGVKRTSFVSCVASFVICANRTSAGRNLRCSDFMLTYWSS